MPGRVPMTAKRGALHASRNRLGRTGQPRLEPMPTRRCSIKVPNAKAPKIAVPFGRAVSQSVGNASSPSVPMSIRSAVLADSIDAVPETPVNPMASAASAVKRKPGARAWNATPRCERPPAPCRSAFGHDRRRRPFAFADRKRILAGTCGNPSPLPVSLWSRSAEAALCLCRSETDPCRHMRQGSVRPPP